MTITLTPANSTLLFVYGSLRQGYPLNHYLRNAEYVGEASVWGRLFYHPCGAYPVLASALDCWNVDKSERVHGEVWRVPDWDIGPIATVELIAGYEARWVQVKRFIQGKEYVTEDALTFTWPGETDDLRRVPGDDWTNAEPQRGWVRREESAK